jgi:hypothetical protein
MCQVTLPRGRASDTLAPTGVGCYLQLADSLSLSLPEKTVRKTYNYSAGS